ncbi:MAG: 50S ribosomal protein L11 methyltransferase [Planctomycetes bacterium]|nr:50S ribosomal protein L11 methyltransferase [Planctomycetota bacterium]
MSNPPVKWTEVRVLVPESWQELVAEALAIGPCTSVAFGRPSLAVDAPPAGFEFVRTFLPSTSDSPEVRDELLAVLRALASNTGAAELADLRVEFKELPHEDYANSWKKSWKPFRARRLCVLPSWSRARPRPGDRVLKLEPGGAFGSGRHATTRTCLFVLQERIRGGERVLDAGSGSGILAVTAALLGAREALGFDIDPTAETYANALAKDNGVDARCRFATGGFEHLRGTYDVVLANIYSDVIQLHAKDLAAALAPNGWFAFSGCPMHHADATRAAILTAGLTLEEERVRGRWHTLVGARPREG